MAYNQHIALLPLQLQQTPLKAAHNIRIALASRVAGVIFVDQARLIPEKGQARLSRGVAAACAGVCRIYNLLIPHTTRQGRLQHTTVHLWEFLGGFLVCHLVAKPRVELIQALPSLRRRMDARRAQVCEKTGKCDV